MVQSLFFVLLVSLVGIPNRECGVGDSKALCAEVRPSFPAQRGVVWDRDVPQVALEELMQGVEALEGFDEGGRYRHVRLATAQVEDVIGWGGVGCDVTGCLQTTLLFRQGYERVPVAGEKDIMWSDLWYKLGVRAYTDGVYDRAISYLGRSVGILERLYGDDWRRVGYARLYLALAYYAQGEAMGWHEAVAGIPCEEVPLGEEGFAYHYKVALALLGRDFPLMAEMHVVRLFAMAKVLEGVEERLVMLCEQMRLLYGPYIGSAAHGTLIGFEERIGAREVERPGFDRIDTQFRLGALHYLAGNYTGGKLYFSNILEAMPRGYGMTYGKAWIGWWLCGVHEWVEDDIPALLLQVGGYVHRVLAGLMYYFLYVVADFLFVNRYYTKWRWRNILPGCWVYTSGSLANATSIDFAYRWPYCVYADQKGGWLVRDLRKKGWMAGVKRYPFPSFDKVSSVVSKVRIAPAGDHYLVGTDRQLHLKRFSVRTCYFSRWNSDMAWSPCGEQLVWGRNSHRIRIYSTRTYCETQRLRGATSCTRSIDWSSNGLLIASVDSDAVHLWVKTTHPYVRVLVRRYIALHMGCMGRYPGGYKLIGDFIGFIHMYRIENKEMFGLSFSHDSRHLAVVSRDRVCLYDITADLGFRFRHGYKPFLDISQEAELAWSPDDRLVFLNAKYRNNVRVAWKFPVPSRWRVRAWLGRLMDRKAYREGMIMSDGGDRVLMVGVESNARSVAMMVRAGKKIELVIYKYPLRWWRGYVCGLVLMYGLVFGEALYKASLGIG